MRLSSTGSGFTLIPPARLIFTFGVGRALAQ